MLLDQAEIARPALDLNRQVFDLADGNKVFRPLTVAQADIAQDQILETAVLFDGVFAGDQLVQRGGSVLGDLRHSVLEAVALSGFAPESQISGMVSAVAEKCQ